MYFTYFDYMHYEYVYLLRACIYLVTFIPPKQIVLFKLYLTSKILDASRQNQSQYLSYLGISSKICSRNWSYSDHCNTGKYVNVCCLKIMDIALVTIFYFSPPLTTNKLSKGNEYLSVMTKKHCRKGSLFNLSPSDRFNLICELYENQD